jgi:negative elongation factor A
MLSIRLNDADCRDFLISDNPCPQQGNVLSIRLSENKEMIQQADGTSKTMLADMFFQMNYETGEWKRIKKYRECPET